MADSLDNMSMAEIFRLEVAAQVETLTEGLLAVETNAATAQTLEGMMRAAHSIKGAARLVGVLAAESVAHAMEDVFVASQKGEVKLGPQQVDVLLEGCDKIRQTAEVPEETLSQWTLDHTPEIQALTARIVSLNGNGNGAAAPPASKAAPATTSAPPAPGAPRATTAPATTSAPPAPASPPAARAATPEPHAAMASPPAPPPARPAVEPAADTEATASAPRERTLRLAADRLDALLGLTGEVQVSARWLASFLRSMGRLRQLQFELAGSLEQLSDGSVNSQLLDAQRLATQCCETLNERLTDLEAHDRRMYSLSNRLHQEVIASRMRPFADGIGNFRRMVRDLARSLNKEAQLEILGLDTLVDRDILERLETPLTHLLRNALDHGLEFPADRQAAGKAPQGTIVMSATHRGGLLSITVEDDGRGLEAVGFRQTLVRKGLVSDEMAQRLTEEELFEFLFLPSFSTKTEVSEISGRGVGLDAVRSVVQELGGRVTLSQRRGGGLSVHVLLPLTLSVVRAMCVDIGSEAYAVPFSRIECLLRVTADEVQDWEGKPHVMWGNYPLGLIWAHQILDVGNPPAESVKDFSVMVLGSRNHRRGVIVNRFIGEHELVVQPLDPRLGKVESVNSGAILDDGSVIIILDVDDMLRSIDRIVTSGSLFQVGRAEEAPSRARKRVLVIDDSITVREVERKILELQGYQVEVAVDGMDGWNALRSRQFDLVVTDVDMPRLDGFKLTSLIKGDPTLGAIPVIIVSYKDREQDRRLGMEAGADYYLTKGSFQDRSFIQAVSDLVGE